MMDHLSPRFSGAVAAATLLGATLFMLPSPTLAQASAAPAARTTPASDPVEARIRSLHDALHITAAQEPQWQAVADVMRDNARTVGALIGTRSTNANTMTAVDDLHSYEAIADAHAAGVRKLTAAFETLYAALSDAQRKDADAAFRNRPQPSHPHKPG